MNWLAVVLPLLLCAVHYIACTEHDDYYNKDKGLLFDVFPESILSFPINAKDIQQQTTQVPDKMECVFACIGVPWCRSMNFQTTVQKNGLHVCELLSTDKHTRPNNMARNNKFTHYSIKNPCAENPCRHGGTCSIQKNRQDYRCKCKKGFHGSNCQNDVDECSTHTHTCHADANCTNNVGSFSCQCKPGYQGNGETCTDVNECSTGVHTCHANASCANNIGSFTCQCNSGFRGNGHTCADLPCNSYTTITDTTRNVKYGSTPQTLICDDTIALRWYRLSGAAGVRMPSACVPTHRCSTHASGWLIDSHPTIQQGTITRKVCFHWSNDCCHWSRYINVSNCGGFFIYQFAPTPGCSLRYCGED